MKNIILNTDSYKCSHYAQYEPSVTQVNSYIESRGGRWNRVLFYGLQGFIKEYLVKPITMDDVNEAKDFITAHGLPFNEVGWKHIVNNWGGKLPLEIHAVKEGTVLPTNNVLVQVRNNDPNLPWLTNYIETALLRAVWYPTTVATNSYMCKQIIRQYLEMTGTPESIDFKLHDFGARGVSSLESAMIGGSAHLINFKGTDTVAGALYAQKYYNPTGMTGFSIPASEHSTTTSWTKEGEKDFYLHMLKQFGGKGKMFSVVIDTYDTFQAIDVIFKEIAEDIKNSGGTVVLRPDSGNPVAMAASCLEHMLYVFGSTTNAKGYKVLPDYVRLIYGDGITEESIGDILRELTMRKISADNIAFGMGGALLQHFNRDTLKFAMKASAIRRNGDYTWHPICKNPITDPGKKSKAGVLSLVRYSNGIYGTIPTAEIGERNDLLELVYCNGELKREQSFDEIRALSNQE